MARLHVVCAALALLASTPSTPARAQQPAAAPAGLPPASVKDRFLALKAEGDKARARGDLPRAVEAYVEALNLYDDATLHGRLGMVAARAHIYGSAAHHLHLALRRGGGSDAEKLEFAMEFGKLRPKVSLVHFEINVQGSHVTLDQSEFVADGGYEEMFIASGHHSVRAQADGYDDDSAEFEAPAGGEVTVKLVLERPELPAPKEPSEEPLRPADVEKLPLVYTEPGPERGAEGPTNELPFRVEAGLGFAMSPYGLPSVAIGGNGMVGFRWTRFALAADIRGLITPASGIGEPEIPGRTSLLTISVLPCGVVSVVDLCAVASISRLAFDLPPPRVLTTADGFSAGFGGRVAGRWGFAERWSLVFYGEVTGELRSLVLRDIPEGGSGTAFTFWRSPLARVNVGAAVAVDLFR